MFYKALPNKTLLNVGNGRTQRFFLTIGLFLKQLTYIQNININLIKEVIKLFKRFNSVSTVYSR